MHKWVRSWLLPLHLPDVYALCKCQQRSEKTFDRTQGRKIMVHALLTLYYWLYIHCSFVSQHTCGPMSWYSASPRFQNPTHEAEKIIENKWARLFPRVAFLFAELLRNTTQMNVDDHGDYCGRTLDQLRVVMQKYSPEAQHSSSLLCSQATPAA